MSHFTVMVVTENEPTDEMLAETLQPFHEFECTGTDDQYVQDMDVTEEVRVDYEKETKKKHEVGSFVEFAKEWHSVESIPFADEPDLAEIHKHGYIRLDASGEVAQVINRTNPNSKWDWWVVGGRFSGLLFGKCGLSANVSLKGRVDFDKMKCDDGSPIRCFAFLRDGQWHERGKMGMLACVSDEKEDWGDQYDLLMADVPDNHWLTIMDCHI